MSDSDSTDKTQLNAEVIWCIQHLESSLASGKLSEKKSKEFRTCYKLIKNPETPLPRLRQAMRNACGDYKAKMKAEESVVRLDSIKILPATVEKSQCNFIKKASSTREESSALLSLGLARLPRLLPCPQWPHWGASRTCPRGSVRSSLPSLSFCSQTCGRSLCALPR